MKWKGEGEESWVQKCKHCLNKIAFVFYHDVKVVLLLGQEGMERYYISQNKTTEGNHRCKCKNIIYCY